MRSSAATSPRLSPRVITAALIVWQSTRHLVAESIYPREIKNRTDVGVLSTVHLAAIDGRAGQGGMVCFFLASFYFVVLL